MTPPDYTEHFETYWSERFESASRLELETAARNPLANWLLADIGVITDEDIGVEVGDLHRHPDDLIADAQEGFERFVADAADIDVESVEDLDYLPIHFVGASPEQKNRVLALDDPIADRGTLTTVENVALESDPVVRQRAASITYRCPADHETTVSQQLYDVRTLETCGNPDCGNEVHFDDRATRVRPVAEFDVEVEGESIRCVGTGLVVAKCVERIRNATRVHLVGICRGQTHDDGTVEPVFEVLHAGRS